MLELKETLFYLFLLNIIIIINSLETRGFGLGLTTPLVLLATTLLLVVVIVGNAWLSVTVLAVFTADGSIFTLRGMSGMAGPVWARVDPRLAGSREILGGDTLEPSSQSSTPSPG